MKSMKTDGDNVLTVMEKEFGSGTIKRCGSTDKPIHYIMPLIDPFWSFTCRSDARPHPHHQHLIVDTMLVPPCICSKASLAPAPGGHQNVQRVAKFLLMNDEWWMQQKSQVNIRTWNLDPKLFKEVEVTHCSGRIILRAVDSQNSQSVTCRCQSFGSGSVLPQHLGRMEIVGWCWKGRIDERIEMYIILWTFSIRNATLHKILTLRFKRCIARCRIFALTLRFGILESKVAFRF